MPINPLANLDIAVANYLLRVENDTNLAELSRRVEAMRDRRAERASRPFKTCPKCSEDLPARAFAEDSKRPDGLQSECRSCRSRPIL